MSNRKPRSSPPSTDALRLAGPRLLTRLSRHLDAVDSGETAAEDDVATVLRTLCAKGSGNHVLLRLVRHGGLEEPQVIVSSPLPGPANGVEIGHLPLGPGPEGVPGVTLSLQGWLNSRVLWLDSANRKSTSWEQLLRDYGTVYGAHSGISVPEALDQLTMFEAAGTNLGTMLLRQAGYLVERLLAGVLIELGLLEEAPVRPLDFHGVSMGNLRVSVPRATDRYATVEGYFAVPPGQPMTVIVRVPLGSRGSMTIARDGGGTTESEYFDPNGDRVEGVRFANGQVTGF